MATVTVSSGLSPCQRHHSLLGWVYAAIRHSRLVYLNVTQDELGMGEGRTHKTLTSLGGYLYLQCQPPWDPMSPIQTKNTLIVRLGYAEAGSHPFSALRHLEIRVRMLS